MGIVLVERMSMALFDWSYRQSFARFGVTGLLRGSVSASNRGIHAHMPI